MRLSLRFVVPLFLALAIFAYAAVPLVDRLTLKWFVRDLDIRVNLIANTVEDPLQDLIRTGNRRRMDQFFTRITQDERLFAMGFCPTDGATIVATPALPKEITCAALERFNDPKSNLLQTAKGPVLVSVRPIRGTPPGDALTTPALDAPLGRLVLVHDMSFIARRSRETREYLYFFFIGLGLTVALITVVIAQLSWRGWMQGLRGLLRGESVMLPPGGRLSASRLPPPELRPIAKDLSALIDDLRSDLRSRDEDQLAWTPSTLREILHRELRGQEVIVVSNREPYIHMRRG
ncbi:MAG TPA: hypothetical protein VFK20_15295, partial [Vicinamibacterales bacterium]|nr:hypothetical protein [Vicinamibacterales bacterium]